MEQQFILRVPEQLQSLDLSEAKLIKHSPLEVSLVHGDSSYPGVICRLPTIIESQKDIDGKLFKVADISTVIVIFEKTDINAIEEKTRIEASGLTPPMGNAREKRVLIPEDIGEVDRRLAELLREDARAESVEFFEPNVEESSLELDLLAAEIEENIGETEPSIQTMSSLPVGEDIRMDKDTTTPGGRTLTTEVSPADDICSSSVPRDVTVETTVSTGTVVDPGALTEQAADTEAVDDKLDDHPEIIAIKDKIKEKEELLNKALNPILKKRFTQALTELKAELELKKAGLRKG
ncbi:hypothetical protein PAEPH01_0338 [Pancytospora epiphaga]|nr:hypothetical protein PAEPH01_0338 [Pancytospora epiphaga]